MSAALNPTNPTALAVIPASQVSTIVAADTADILGKLAAKVAAHEPDISTPKGRREIASLAAEVASGKMDLIRLGKGLTEGWRKSTAAVNAECRVIEERMDALKTQVRAPLTAFEEREAVRVKAHEAALAAIPEDEGFGQVETVDELMLRLKALRNPAPRDWEEFSQRAVRAYEAEISRTKNLLVAAQRREEEQAAAARALAEQQEQARQEAARVQAEREAGIAAAAAARARQETEAEAERQRQAELQRVEAERRRMEAEARQAAEQAAAERQQIEADARAAAERAEAERQQDLRARHDAEARAARAERERITAEKQAAADRIAAAEKADRDRAAAVQAEQDRAAAAAKAEQDAADRRAADKAHRSRVNRAAADALALAGITAEQAAAVVTAIARGEVPAITIRY